MMNGIIIPKYLFKLWIVIRLMTHKARAASSFSFSSISPARNVRESIETFDDRRNLVLQWFSGLPLMPCEDEDKDGRTNCFLDSRTDTRRLCDWTVANIILGQPVKEAEDIILHPSTVPFGISGTGVNKYDPNAYCHRKGDYDFVLTNWLHLAYVSRDYPGILSDEAYSKIVRKMLTVSGNDHDPNYDLACGRFVVSLEDTENHVLMEEVAQYLTNQLLAELPGNENNTKFDNALNGNDEFMLDYLSHFFRDHFYEYNSRPYQAYTVLPLTLLCDYAKNTKVALAADMLLDVISGWTAMQTSKLRRFVPFRRQGEYLAPSEIDEREGWYSWSGDGGQYHVPCQELFIKSRRYDNGVSMFVCLTLKTLFISICIVGIIRSTEAERLAMLVGNYGYLENLGWVLPEGDGQRHFILFAATTSYRMDEVLLDIAIGGGSPQFLTSYHNTVEIHYSSLLFHLSAGGIYRDAESFDVRNVPSWLEKYIINEIVDSDKEAGWAQPTTLVPTKESSADIRDMIRFEGNTDLEQRSNTCVAPRFLCGLAPLLGTKVGAVVNRCTGRKSGRWKFFDFRSSAGCPLDYGLYVALYEAPCDSDRCSRASNTNTFGVMEVAETSSLLTFDQFSMDVLSNNAGSFNSSGVETYVTISGDTIQFEVFPSQRGFSSLRRLNDEQFDEDSRTWPLARGSAIESTVPGLYTFNGPSIGKRLVIDMTHPQDPRRFTETVASPTMDSGNATIVTSLSEVSQSSDSIAPFQCSGLAIILAGFGMFLSFSLF